MAIYRRIFERILSELRGNAGIDLDRLLSSLGRRVEELIDALDPEQLAELMADPDWKSRLRELADGIGGAPAEGAGEAARRRAEEARRSYEAWKAAREAEQARRDDARRKADEARRARGGASGRGHARREPPPPPRDPWSILGVTRDATRAQIRAAYHRLAKANHPDALGPAATDAERRTAEARMREINEAYSTLKSAPRR